MPDPRDCDAAVEDFVLLYVGDRDRGRVREEADYLRLYPGCEESISREWRRVGALYDLRPSTPASPESPPERRSGPEVVGRYRIESELGRGAQGTVFRAIDTQLGRPVALKVLKVSWTGSEEMVERFAREARALARLDHPGIAAIHDAGSAHGLEYIAMQFVEGHTLADEIASATAANGPPDARVRVARYVTIVEKCSRALHVAHEGGLIHRDVKPANVMITKGDEPVILDFGLARFVDLDARRVTATGDVLGTPAFMAPEQLAGDIARIDRRVDVYALAATLRALVASVPGAAAVGRDLIAVLETASQPSPDRRYASAEAFADDLARVRRGEPVAVRRPGPIRRLATWARRAPAAAALAILPPVALLAGSIGLSIKNAEIRDAALRLDVRRADADAATLEAKERFAAFQRLEDLRLVRELDERDRDLWPPHPANAAAMEAWLADAAALVGRLPGHRAALDTLRKRATRVVARRRGLDPLIDRMLDVERVRATADAELAAPTASAARRANLTKTLEKAVEDLVDLESAAASRAVWTFVDARDRWLHDDLSQLVARLELLDGTSEHGCSVASMKTRLATARALERRSLAEPAAAWREAIAAIAADPIYDGLKIEPILGLVPLGCDSKSRLFEFAHVLSGTPPVRGADGRLAITEETGIVLVLVPGGVLQMGARPPSDPDEPLQSNVDPGARPQEGPVHEVSLDPFLISKYELTQAQWVRATGMNPSFAQPGRRFETEEVRDLLHPVEQVSFDDCADVLRRFALAFPTEAQWEFAARGGTTTPWWAGETIATFLAAENLADRTYVETAKVAEAHDRERNDGWSGTAPVGSYPANPFGLHDVMGNVGEWCRDRIDFYKTPALPGDGLRADGLVDARAVRGGAFNDPARNARSAYRYGMNAATRAPSIGVRPALEVLRR